MPRDEKRLQITAMMGPCANSFLPTALDEHRVKAALVIGVTGQRDIRGEDREPLKNAVCDVLMELRQNILPLHSFCFRRWLTERTGWRQKWRCGRKLARGW
jgi:hypothetical protein